MSIPLLIIGIIFLIVGICSFIGSIIVSNFSSDSCKIMKFNDIHEKFERHNSLEGFISGYSSMSGVILMFIGFLLVADYFMPSKAPTPTAIDVYRGKTEIEIHSINNIPQDTVVVWKDAALKNQ